jgi:hypothetical protein
MIVQHDDRAISHRQRWERTERSATTSASRTVSNTRADAIGDAVMIYKTSSKQFRWTQESRDVAPSAAKTEAFKQSSRDRKRVEMLFVRLKRILRLGRLRLRGPCGAQFEFTLAAIAQNLRRLAKLIARPPPIAALCAA